MEEYKEQADLLKEKGNKAFQAGDIDSAINFFNQSLDIDPDNHIVFSNRSAAYLKAGQKSKALYDAEKCVELSPNWSKGYSRLGAAQQSLKRFDAAIDSFKKGIELDPNNSSLWTALQKCQEAFNQDKKIRFEQAAKEREVEELKLKRKEDIKQEILHPTHKVQEEELLDSFFADVNTKKTDKVEPSTVSNETENKEDDLLASFFGEISEKPKPVEIKKVIETIEEIEPENSESVENKISTLTEKYTVQKIEDGKAIIEKLLCKHSEWKNLNPYYVFDLDIDATEEDIKFRYKKLSLKVHPDRLRDVPNAREAFEQIKTSYEKLINEDQRKTIIMHIENVTNELKRERKRLISKGVSEKDLPNFEDERKVLLMKHFADLEMMKRKSETNRRVYSAREREQEEEEDQKNTRFEEFEKSWSEDNRREKRVGNWREFQTVDPIAKKAKSTNYKPESRDDAKFGSIKLETWKKSWK